MNFGKMKNCNAKTPEWLWKCLLVLFLVFQSHEIKTKGNCIRNGYVLAIK
jgi:hypothetical protein